MSPLFLKELSINPDWEGFLTSGIRRAIIEIEQEVTKTKYTPAPEKVLRFLSVPLSSVKIIILGQDPYPQEGVATGRAFEVGTLKSWNEPFNNISLKNILRSLYKAYSGRVIKFNELKAKFDNEFPVLPPDKLFSNWEGQGVLLLNTYFTCEVGKPGSHKSIWGDFSLQLFRFISTFNDRIVWFLWGTHAIEYTRQLENIKAVASMHPMMCFDKPGRETDFLYGEINCFEQYKHQINWAGYTLKEGFQPARTLF